MEKQKKSASFCFIFYRRSSVLVKNTAGLAKPFLLLLIEVLWVFKFTNFVSNILYLLTCCGTFWVLFT